MKNLIPLAVVFLLLLTGCAKTKAKKNIVGTWYETKINDMDVPVGAQDKMVFTKIKGGEGSLSLYDAGSSVAAVTYTYWLEDGGEKLVLELLGGGIASIKTSRQILELTETTMKIDWGNNTYIGTYTKE